MSGRRSFGAIEKLPSGRFRARYQVDGRWVSDTSSDYGRIARQQDFVRRLATKALAAQAQDGPVTSVTITGPKAVAKSLPFAGPRPTAISRRCTSRAPSRMNVCWPAWSVCRCGGGHSKVPTSYPDGSCHLNEGSMPPSPRLRQ